MNDKEDMLQAIAQTFGIMGISQINVGNTTYTLPKQNHHLAMQIGNEVYRRGDVVRIELQESRFSKGSYDEGLHIIEAFLPHELGWSVRARKVKPCKAENNLGDLEHEDIPSFLIPTKPSSWQRNIYRSSMVEYQAQLQKRLDWWDKHVQKTGFKTKAGFLPKYGIVHLVTLDKKGLITKFEGPYQLLGFSRDFSTCQLGTPRNTRRKVCLTGKTVSRNLISGTINEWQSACQKVWEKRKKH
jgi:hypothetical protein